MERRWIREFTRIINNKLQKMSLFRHGVKDTKIRRYEGYEGERRGSLRSTEVVNVNIRQHPRCQADIVSVLFKGIDRYDMI